MPVLIILLVVAVAVLVWYVTTSNKIKTLGLKIDEGESNIDVALTKRYDMINQIYQSVKGAIKHESETLTKIVELRSKKPSTDNMKERQELDNLITEAKNEINVVLENYPELKANQNFLQLQDSILDVEENLQAARRIYNSNVTYYNNLIVMFPSNIVAKNMNVEKRDYFEQTDEKKKETVNLEF